MHRILIAGSGGQGILFMGKVIAECVMREGKNVTWIPSYGAEMRGGTANCTVVFSGEVIGSPVVRQVDILIVMNSASARKFQGRLKEGGLFLYDSSLVKGVSVREDVRACGVPASETAASLGNPKAANMVLLGAVIGQTGLFKPETAEATLDEITPERRRDTLGLNIEAVRRGVKFRGH